MSCIFSPYPSLSFSHTYIHKTKSLIFVVNLCYILIFTFIPFNIYPSMTLKLDCFKNVKHFKMLYSLCSYIYHSTFSFSLSELISYKLICWTFFRFESIRMEVKNGLELLFILSMNEHSLSSIFLES